MTDFNDCILRDADGNEIKEWYALAAYLQSFGEDGLPEQPATGNGDGRKTVSDSWSISALLSHPGLTTWAALGVAVVLILLVVGCLMDNIAATLILAPIFIPIGIQLGCNELHIGMLFCIVLVVGFVTPPFGYNLFTAVSLTGLNFKQVVKGTAPFLIVEIALLFLFAYCPGIITWLPDLLSKVA